MLFSLLLITSMSTGSLRKEQLRVRFAQPPRDGRFRPSLPCALLGRHSRVVAPRSVEGRPPGRIYLHPAQRQHEHAECEQAKYPTAERRKHRLSICVTRAFRTAIAEATWSAQRLAVQRRGRRTNASLMLLQFPCGDCVRCNGFMGGRLFSETMWRDNADHLGTTCGHQGDDHRRARWSVRWSCFPIVEARRLREGSRKGDGLP